VRRIILFFSLLCAAFAQTPFVPTTTLAKETGNNSSASDSVSAYTSSHAASGNVSKEPIRKLLYPGANTKVFAALMGWFGKGGHISVGYNSQSSTQVKKQVEDMQSRGIDGAILAWYGQDSFENKVALALKAQAEAHPGFQFAIMIDRGAIEWYSMGLQPTDALIAHFNYIADTYYGSPSYLKINGRPVVLEFALEFYTIDWVRVRNSIRGNPIIIFRNPNGWTRPTSDGAYSWEPSKADMGYLDYFYEQARKYPTLQTMGSLSPSFNDSLASWSQNRFVDPQCGQTWLRKIAETNKFYSSSNQLRFLQLATWNDYEEGSTMESGIDNCIGVQAEARGTSVSWALTGLGDPNTVDHFTVFASRDGQNLMPVANVSADARAFDIASLNLEPGAYSVFVKAIGKPSLLNHMSDAALVSIGLAGGTPSSSTDYDIAASTNNLTLSAAQPASIVLSTRVSSGGSTTLSFACSSLPSWAQCTFTPDSVQTGGSATLVIRAIQTASLEPSGMFSALTLLAVLSAALGTRRNARRMHPVLSIGVLSVFLVACGGGTQTTSQPQTQALQSSTSTITVTARPSDNSLPTRTVTLNVTLTK
jgi:hypothetical protein